MNCMARRGDPGDPAGGVAVIPRGLLTPGFGGGVMANVGVLILGSGVRGARGGVSGLSGSCWSVTELIHFSCMWKLLCREGGASGSTLNRSWKCSLMNLPFR